MTLKKEVSKIDGPGYWSALHTIAYHSDLNEDPEFFIRATQVLISSFRCLKCRKHAVGYLADHPLEEILYRFTINSKKAKWDSKNLRTKFPCCYWINLFHNYVNHRLGKDLWDLSSSIESTKKGCSSCGIKTGTEKDTSKVDLVLEGSSIWRPAKQIYKK